MPLTLAGCREGASTSFLAQRSMLSLENDGQRVRAPGAAAAFTSGPIVFDGLMRLGGLGARALERFVAEGLLRAPLAACPVILRGCSPRRPLGALEKAGLTHGVVVLFPWLAGGRCLSGIRTAAASTPSLWDPARTPTTETCTRPDANTGLRNEVCFVNLPFPLFVLWRLTLGRRGVRT